jgi:hypothetical protein
VRISDSAAPHITLYQPGNSVSHVGPSIAHPLRSSRLPPLAEEATETMTRRQ